MSKNNLSFPVKKKRAEQANGYKSLAYNNSCFS